MKAVQVGKAGGDFEVVERDIPTPEKNEVLIKVEACGICHSDMFVKEGAFPGIEYPRIPGHEVVGVVEDTGEDVGRWNKGQRVGVGWHGGHCFTCDPCRRGDFINCQNAKIAGISYDGGYAEYMVAPQEALASVPEKLNSEEAAPLLCAGITTFNALRNGGASPGDLVAIQGIGGLGHLAVQFASKMGFRTVAISSSDEKKELALKLGANHYIDYKKDDPGEALANMGGAKLILATAPNSEAISKLKNGVGINGKLMIVGADMQPLTISPMDLITGRREVSGWASGTAMDSEDTLNFSALSGAKTMIETFPLEKVAEAYSKMMNNQTRFRAVLVMK
jgi:alcohol dehydrogenase/propanol-preferring alcohol dehydrogenase